MKRPAEYLEGFKKKKYQREDTGSRKVASDGYPAQAPREKGETALNKRKVKAHLKSRSFFPNIEYRIFITLPLFLTSFPNPQLHIQDSILRTHPYDKSTQTLRASQLEVLFKTFLPRVLCYTGTKSTQSDLTP